METWSIDVNCDVGEGVGNEASLFPYISSCNIACGGHAGDVSTMTGIVQLAKAHHIKIGAHPSYPDKTNFGREVMDISDVELKQSIAEQLNVFDKVLQAEHAQLHHIKAHGALYNQTAKDLHLASVYLEAVGPFREKAFLYVPYGSIIAELAQTSGFRIKYEAFGDRNYNPDLTLVSRKKEHALILEPSKVLDHVLPMIKEGKVLTIDGTRQNINAKTICIHGDTSSALQILMYLSNELPKHRVQLQK